MFEIQFTEVTSDESSESVFVIRAHTEAHWCIGSHPGLSAERSGVQFPLRQKDM